MSFYYQKKQKCSDQVSEVCQKHYQEKECVRELKKECNNSGNKGKMAIDFKYVRNGRGLEPNLFPTDDAVTGALPLEFDEETQVAIINFKDLQKKSLIELKAILHILTTEAPGDVAGFTDSVIVRIRKLDGPTFTLSAAEEIYRTGPLPLVPFEDQVTPLLALDVEDELDKCEENLAYVLTVELSTTAVEDAEGEYSLVNPITFTGTEYN